MAKPRNLNIYSSDYEWLKTIREEYTMIGFDTIMGPGVLTVLTRKRRTKKKKNSEKQERNKRAESAARRN